MQRREFLIGSAIAIGAAGRAWGQGSTGQAGSKTDRVAIMKDGEVIQIGTPETLVLHPATSYVAEFTRDVNRAKVMSARSLMSAATIPVARPATTT